MADSRFSSTNKQQAITEGGLLKAIAMLSVPMLAGAVLQNVQSLIDLFWVGRLGSRAVAAVAMSGTILMVLFPMLMGLSTGTIALVARSVGAGRPDDAAAAAGQSLMLAMVLGGISAVLGWFFSPHLFYLLGAEREIIAEGSLYLRISLIGSFTVFVLFIGNAALQGAGDAVRPMVIMAVANVANIILDPLLIYGPGPLPALGVQGAAWATVLSQAAAAGLSLFILVTGRAHLRIHLRQWKPDMNLSWRILKIGLPGSGQMLSRSLMSAVLMKIVAYCGTAAIAAYGVGMRFHMIALMPAFALGGAAATMVGQNLGAGKPARARRAAWVAVGLDIAIMTAIAAGLMIFAPHLIRFFNSEPDVVRIGAGYLQIVSPCYIFAALGIVLNRALNGAGDSMGPMVITVSALWGLQVPLAMVLPRFMSQPTHGIWWAIVIAIVVQGLLSSWWFEQGAWMMKKV